VYYNEHNTIVERKKKDDRSVDRDTDVHFVDVFIYELQYQSMEKKKREESMKESSVQSRERREGISQLDYQSVKKQNGTGQTY
jgi:hypothetical protein